MSDFTPNLGLPYLLSNQAQKHVTLNESLRALDGLLYLAVLDRDLTAPPEAPADGERYLVGEGASGDWTGQDGALALYCDGEWFFFAAQMGWCAWVQDEALFFVHDGAIWRETTSDKLQNLALLGIGAAADASNPLLAKLNASLFTALEAGSGGTGDLRFKLNKENSANVLSLLLQDGYSTRAEIGLVGDDDLLLKVSPDGSAFHEALRVDRNSGRVSLPCGSDNIREVLLSHRTYYVNASTGDDTNDGLTSGAAFETIDRALGVVLELDLAGHDVTIQLAAGSYAPFSLSERFTGAGMVTIVGDEAVPTNCDISGGAQLVSVTHGAMLSIAGLHVHGSSGNGVFVASGGQLYVSGNCDFGDAANAVLLCQGAGAYLSVEAHCSISGSAKYLLRALHQGHISTVNRTLTFDGAQDYSSATTEAGYLGYIYAPNTSFAGDAASVTGKRYNASVNGAFFTGGGGASFFPGDAAGTATTGGQYA